MRYYIDSSAAAKLLIEKTETKALRAFCAQIDVELVAIDLLETELRRIGQREALPAGDVAAVLAGVTMHAAPRSAYVQAGLLPGPGLRSLDALHITGALRLEAEAALIYDTRMREAAAENGLRVLAPGDETWPDR